MKTATMILTVAAVVLASPVYAGSWDNPDTTGGIMQTLDQPGYVGTSMQDPRKRGHIGVINANFPNADVDETGFVAGTAGPEKGYGDSYGSVLLD